MYLLAGLFKKGFWPTNLRSNLEKTLTRFHSYGLDTIHISNDHGGRGAVVRVDHRRPAHFCCRPHRPPWQRSFHLDFLAATGAPDIPQSPLIPGHFRHGKWISAKTKHPQLTVRKTISFFSSADSMRPSSDRLVIARWPMFHESKVQIFLSRGYPKNSLETSVQKEVYCRQNCQFPWWGKPLPIQLQLTENSL